METTKPREQVQKTTAELLDEKRALLHAYNEAEKCILAGAGTDEDYDAMTESENLLHKVNNELELRGEL